MVTGVGLHGVREKNLSLEGSHQRGEKKMGMRKQGSVDAMRCQWFPTMVIWRKGLGLKAKKGLKSYV